MEDLETYADDALLKLSVAATVAYPDGSMKAGGLRRLAARELLEIDFVNGRYYTTLRAIKEMRERCRVPAKSPEPTSGSARVSHTPDRVNDLGKTPSQVALEATVRELRGNLKAKRQT
ncbi:hypothetical protein [Methylopila sp. Yamaguchi]|uniref:hypothetical protein n=1 Tax=Methylopila sp. Yamaguchi TaxID=1437817 RepID=UPI000CB0A461|nr:hypothetical protein [Methylopila sp. Yamaguchi]GBD48077.1 hypothetical protein METY_1290 [Methylopila sp. Yamaguchi]